MTHLGDEDLGKSERTETGREKARESLVLRFPLSFSSKSSAPHSGIDRNLQGQLPRVTALNSILPFPYFALHYGKRKTESKVPSNLKAASPRPTVTFLHPANEKGENKEVA